MIFAYDLPSKKGAPSRCALPNNTILFNTLMKKQNVLAKIILMFE